MATWDGQSETNIDNIISEYNKFLGLGDFEYESGVDSVINNLKSIAKTIEEETIAADAVQMTADAAAVASIWSFGIGMAVYAAAEVTEKVLQAVISSKSTELNNKLKSADTDIAAKVGHGIPDYIALYKKNNDVIAGAMPKGLDTKTSRAILFKFISNVKKSNNGVLNVTLFKKYAEAARIFKDGNQISKLLDALDLFTLSGQTQADVDKLVATMKGITYPSDTAQQLVYNIAFGIMVYKLKVATDKINKAAQNAEDPVAEEETTDSAFEELDAFGKFAAAIVVVMSIVDIVMAIINIVDVVKVYNEWVTQFDTIGNNYKAFYKGLKEASVQANQALKKK